MLKNLFTVIIKLISINLVQFSWTYPLKSVIITLYYLKEIGQLWKVKYLQK